MYQMFFVRHRNSDIKFCAIFFHYCVGPARNYGADSARRLAGSRTREGPHTHPGSASNSADTRIRKESQTNPGSARNRISGSARIYTYGSARNRIAGSARNCRAGSARNRIPVSARNHISAPQPHNNYNRAPPHSKQLA